EHLQARGDRRELRARRSKDLDGVGLDGLHLVLVSVELRIREHLDLNATVGLLLDLVGEAVGCESLRRTRRCDVGETQYEPLLVTAARGVAPAEHQQTYREAGKQRLPSHSSHRRHRQLQCGWPGKSSS